LIDGLNRVCGLVRLSRIQRNENSADGSNKEKYQKN